MNADEAGRRFCVAGSGPGARLTVFNPDTLESACEIPYVGAHGAFVSSKINHGFANRPRAQTGTPKGFMQKR